MRYDFSTIMDRHGLDAIAVDAAPCAGQVREGFDVIPMWIADMNFPTVPSIPRAIISRAEHPAYGYFSPRQEYYDAIIRWQRERNGVEGLEPTQWRRGSETGAHRLRQRRAGRSGQRGERAVLPGRQDSGALPHLYRLYPRFGE